MGPFKVLARTAPNTYWRTCAAFNVERLRPYLRRPDHLGGEAAPPPPVIGVDVRPEHEVQELLKFKMRSGSVGPALRAGSLGGARRVGRHVGAARQADELRGGRRSLRAGHWPLSASAPPRAAAAGRRRGRRLVTSRFQLCSLLSICTASAVAAYHTAAVMIIVLVTVRVRILLQ